MVPSVCFPPIESTEDGLGLGVSVIRTESPGILKRNKGCGVETHSKLQLT